MTIRDFADRWNCVLLKLDINNNYYTRLEKMEKEAEGNYEKTDCKKWGQPQFMMGVN